MPGIEQFLNNPGNAGLLQGAFKGMQMAGPSRMPVSMGQGIGAAGSVGLGAFFQAQDRELQRGLLSAKIEGMNLENKYLKEYASGKSSDGAPGSAAFGVGDLQTQMARAIRMSGSPVKAERSQGHALMESLKIQAGLQSQNAGLVGDFQKSERDTQAFNFGKDPSEMMPPPSFPVNWKAGDAQGIAPPFKRNLTAPNEEAAYAQARALNDRNIPFGVTSPTNAGAPAGVSQQFRPRDHPAIGQTSAASAVRSPAEGRQAFTPPVRLQNETGESYRKRYGEAEAAYRADQSLTEKELATERRKYSHAESAKYDGIWDDAEAKIGQFDLLENLFKDPNVVSGKAAETVAGLKSIADTFGVNMEGAAAEDTIRAITTNMALKAKMEGGKNLLPGAMSEAENAMLAAMVPGLSQTKEGRLLLIQVLKAKANKEKKIAEFAFAYADKHGKIDRGFKKEARAWGQANPLYSDKMMEAMILHAKRLTSGKR
ncbi:MAG TPA: hypothetical protein VMW70_10060 [Burkholderiales bacterium]|nr:hypothetical protein [Burkholderiales bacterium]